MKRKQNDCVVLIKLIDLKLFSLVATQGRRKRDVSDQMSEDNGEFVFLSNMKIALERSLFSTILTVYVFVMWNIHT